jgi:hypothetical protein
MDSSDDSNNNFFKHVFNFDDDSKSDILNIIQYAILAIIPVVILNKSIGKYVPEADDKKGSLELSAEIVIQIIVTFIGLLLIHRMITFVPTYSNTKYVDFSVMYNILAVLMITMSLQTKLGEKVSILVDRLMELWNGPSDKKKKNGAVKVSQPISGQQILQQQAPPPPMYTDGTAISSLPTSDSQPDSSQQMPNYNNMYRQDTTPLVGAATPSMSEGFGGPVAASEFLGGGGFGSSW